MIRITVKSTIVVAICLIVTCAAANGQDHPNVPSSDIDRSVQVVDVSVHAEVDEQAHEPAPPGTSAKLTMSLRPVKPAATAVWSHTAMTAPGEASQSDKLTFSGPSFHPSAQAPIATVSLGLIGAAASASGRGGHSETLDQRPGLFTILSTHRTDNGSTPSLGINAVPPLPSSLDETRKLTGRFERNEPGVASSFSFHEGTFARHKGQSGMRKRKRSEQIANSASMGASPKSRAAVTHKPLENNPR